MTSPESQPLPESTFGSSLKPYAPRVFVSASTGDLGSYRQMVRDELIRGGCFPVVQEYFSADPRRLSQFLEDAIRPCDAVVCLLGPRFGAAPESGGSPRSYTQLEYDAARQFGKDVYAFVASPSCPLDHPPDEAEDRSRLQQVHIESVQQRDQTLCSAFSGIEDLRAQLLRLLPALAKSKQPKYWVQSPSPYPYFAGREAELAQLTKAAAQPGPCLVAILGTAGQGKSTLAWEWLSHHLPDVFAAAFWCPAEGNEYTFDMFVDYALSYLAQGKYDKRSFPDISGRIRLLVQHLRDRPCLLMVDGVEKWLQAWARQGNSESGGHLGAQEGLDLFLAQVCAVSGGSRVILTSRVLPAALESAPHAVIPVLDELVQSRLQGLDDAAAVALLRRLGVVQRTDAELLDVANLFEKHPLSLTILGKVAIRKYDGQIDRFKERKAVIREDLKLKVLLDEMQTALPKRKDSDHLLDLLAHFIETPTYEQYASFLRWIALGTGHTALMASPGLHVDDDALREALATLDDWSLVTWDRPRHVLHVHPLVREYFRTISTRAAAVNRALSDWYRGAEVPAGGETLDQMKPRIRALEHALLADDACRCDGVMLAPVSGCSSLAEWMAVWGHQSTGIDLLGKVIARSQPPDRVRHLISRGAMRQDLGQLSEARRDFSEGIEWLRAWPTRRFRHRHDLAGAYMNRGNALAAAGRPDWAVTDFNHALKTLAAPFGLRRGVELIAGDVYMNRGAANRELGHLVAAERDATRALEIYRSHLPADLAPAPDIRDRIATVLLNRGNARANGRRYGEADDDYREALAELVRAYGPIDSRGTPLRALVTEMRGLLFYDRGDWSASIAEHDAAVGLLRELLRQGRNDLRTTLALALMNRADTRLARGETNLAEDDVTSASRIYDATAWEASSRLAIWVAANQATLQGLSRVLGHPITIPGGHADMWHAWQEVSQRQGKHALAPFVRASTGIARLVFAFDPSFSADTAGRIAGVLEDGIRDGYWSEWLAWEVRDLAAFVEAHRERLASLGTPVDAISDIDRELQRRSCPSGGSHGVSVRA
jgi:tetratricopeptide (TPR) repeat protein